MAMKQNLRVSLGAVVLALATLAALIFALLNFDQRTRYEQAYDGVTWIDTEQGVQARHVSPNSPGRRSYLGHSTPAGRSTRSTAKSTGRKLWLASRCPHCCFTSRWFFPGGPNRNCAPPQNCWGYTFSHSPCCLSM